MQALPKTFHWFCTDNIAPLTQFHIIKFKRKYHLKFNNALKYMVFYTNALIMDWYRKKLIAKVDIAWSQNDFQKHFYQKTLD